MNVTFVIRHLVDPFERAAVEERLVELSSSLRRYFRDLREVHWNVSQNADLLEVFCELGALSGTYRARSIHSDVSAAAHDTLEKLVRQRRRVKRQTIGRRRSARRTEPFVVAEDGEAPSNQ